MLRWICRRSWHVCTAINGFKRTGLNSHSHRELSTLDSHIPRSFFSFPFSSLLFASLAFFLLNLLIFLYVERKIYGVLNDSKEFNCHAVRYYRLDFVTVGHFWISHGLFRDRVWCPMGLRSTWCVDKWKLTKRLRQHNKEENVTNLTRFLLQYR